jgi:CheY-like chemotaxis protein
MKREPHILIVDDSRTIRHGLHQLLATQGYQVTEAEDGEKALELAAALNPDLILLDWRMPKFDGFETARRIRALEGARSISIILLTTSDFPAGCDHHPDPHFNGYVSKMAHPDELLSCVKQHLAGRD